MFSVEEAASGEVSEESAEAVQTFKTIADTEHTYILVDTPEKVATLLQKLQASTEFCFDSETTSLNTSRS